jgi:hypothetical protein
VRRGRIIACVVLAGIFLAALVTSLGYSLSDALGPGPGFFPFWLSLIVITLTVAILIETVRRAKPPPGAFCRTGRRPFRAAVCSSRWWRRLRCLSRWDSG